MPLSKKKKRAHYFMVMNTKGETIIRWVCTTVFENGFAKSYQAL
jgi:hypothetical protein